MKVVQISNYYYPNIGGIENTVYNLCSGLKDKVDVSVIASNTKNKTQEENIQGVEVTKVARQLSLFSASINFSLVKHIKESKPDIVHLHLPNPMATIAYLIANPKEKLVITYHSDIVKQRLFMPFFKPFLIKLLKKADKIITATPNHIKYSNILPKFKDKCTIIPFGFDTAKFKLTQKIKKESKGIKSKFGDKIILYAGRLVYYKGIEYLIKAVEGTDATLLIIGDGPLKNKLQSIAGKNVKFLNHVKSLVPYYHACDFFVLPSIEKSEAFGLVQVEAMLCGKPVISTNLPSGVPYVNKHNITGIVVEPRNSKELKRAIIKLLKNKRLRDKMGRTGRQIALKEYDKRVYAKRVLKVYEDIYATK